MVVCFAVSELVLCPRRPFSHGQLFVLPPLVRSHNSAIVSYNWFSGNLETLFGFSSTFIYSLRLGRRKASSYHTTGTYSFSLPRTRKSGIVSPDRFTTGYLKIWKHLYLVRVVYSHFAAYWPRPYYIGAICLFNTVLDCYIYSSIFCVSPNEVRSERDLSKRWSGWLSETSGLIDSKVKVRVEPL